MHGNNVLCSEAGSVASMWITSIMFTFLGDRSESLVAEHASDETLRFDCSGEVLADVDLIWSNCRSFNEPESEICDMADQAQQALRMRWQQEGLPTVTPIAPQTKKQKRDGKQAALDAGELESVCGICILCVVRVSSFALDIATLMYVRLLCQESSHHVRMISSESAS